MRPRATAAAALAVVLAAIPAAIPMAAADAAVQPEDAVTGIVVSVDGGPTTQAVSIQGLYPTASREAVFFLDGEAPQAARRAAFEVLNLRDLENECIRPEVNTDDTTCGPDDDQGELSEFLELGLEAGVEGDQAGQRTCQLGGGSQAGGFIGTLTGEEAAIVGLDGTEGGDDVLCVVATFHHVDGGQTDNVTQTDSVRFDLGITLDGELPDDGGAGTDTEVGGVVLERDVTPDTVVDADTPLAIGLAQTGASLFALAVLGGLLVALGLLLTRVRASRRLPRGVEEVGR